MNFVKRNILALSILISAILLSSALIINGLCDRYTYIDSQVLLFDKLTGTSYNFTSIGFTKISVQSIENVIKKQQELKQKDGTK